MWWSLKRRRWKANLTDNACFGLWTIKKDPAMKFKLSQATKMTYTAKKQRERYCRALGRSKHRKPERWERFPVCCVGQREGNTWRFATHSSDVNKPLRRPTHKCTKHMFSHSEQVTCRRILTRRNLTHALRITQRTTEAHVNGWEKCKKTNVQEIKHLFRASQITWQFALLCFHFCLTFWPAVMGLSAYWNTCSAFPRAA